MALIAPWLRPPDVLEAMRSGASLGLQLRGQNIAQQEAAARREQEAAELEVRQQTAADALRVQRETGAARLAMAASQAAALAGHRGEQRKLDEAAHALRVRAEGRLEKHQKFLEEQAAKEAAGEPLDIIYDDVTKRHYQRRNGKLYPVTSAPTSGTTPLEKGLSGMHQAEMREAAKLRLQEQLETTPDTNRVNAANQLINSASNQLFRLSPQSLPAPSTGGTNRVAVISPDGKRGTVSEANLEEALKAGYKRR